MARPVSMWWIPAGAMNMNDIRDRFRALKAVLKPETATGMHAHHNLSLRGGELDRRGGRGVRSH